ncbi:E3 ubiquitin-protein ligase RING1-like [Linum grandiflorum]
MSYPQSNNAGGVMVLDGAMPAAEFVLATPATPSQTQLRYNAVREQLMRGLDPAEETMMPPPMEAARMQRRRPRRVRLLVELARELDYRTEDAVAASADEYEMRTTGASESAIAKLERVEIGGGWKQDDCCSICLEEMDSGEGEAIRLDCRHVFHEGCLVSWLRTSNCCPLCRFRIPDS